MENKESGSPNPTHSSRLNFFNTIAICINSMFSLGFTGYLFWTGFLYLIGSMTTLSSWIYFAPRLQDTIPCPSIGIYAISVFWAIQGVALLITCYLYSSMVGEDFENELYKPTRSINILGFLVKILPILARFLHLFAACIIFTNIFNSLILPECNCIYIRRIIAFIIIIWWIITIFGIIVRNRTALPPYLYSPHHYGGVMYNIQVSLKYFGI